MGRLVRACGRVKAYFLECQRNMAPMPNPEWYEETKHTRFTLENIRKLPLETHLEVWRSAFQTYGQSFEESFAWNRKRKEKAGKKKVEENMLALREIVKDVQEATHKTPEDLAASKKALKELLDEIQDNQEGIKSWTEEKLDLIRFSLSEFSTGYREARDQEMKRVMAMDKDMLKGFVQERWEEVKSASSILSNSIFSNDKGTEKQEIGERKPGDWGRVSVGEATTPIPLREFLSQRVRNAFDSIPKDPDMQQLLERAEGFTKERLVQAEAAARILKEEEAKESGEGEGEWKGIDDRDPREGTGLPSSPQNFETPILSGMANDARDFVEGKVGEAKEATKEVVDTILEVRESHRAAAGSSDGDRSGPESGEGVLGKGRGQEEQPNKEGGNEGRVGDRRDGDEEIGGGRR